MCDVFNYVSFVFFTAVKDSRQNSINSNWKIELPGDFELAGTVVRYVRRGHWEKMSIKGPTKTPLHLMVKSSLSSEQLLIVNFTLYKKTSVKKGVSLCQSPV